MAGEFPSDIAVLPVADSVDVVLRTTNIDILHKIAFVQGHDSASQRLAERH